MGYVAVRGGEAAIAEAIRSLDVLRAGGTEPGADPGDPLEINAIRHQLRLLVDRVMGEGGLYDPQLAALAIKQAHGDPLEAAFILRAHRSNLPRLGTSPAHRGSELRLIRRISSAFKEIPGGQRLGPSTDYLQRLFRLDLLDEDPAAFRAAARSLLGDPEDAGSTCDFPKVVELLRAQGLLQEVGAAQPAIDITRDPVVFPIPRPARLAHLARGETGGVLTMAYTTMRGYGYLHPTVAELRVGYLPVRLPHPLTGELVEAGEVLITECEIVATHGGGPGPSGGEGTAAPPRILLGYGACLGHNEVKAIAIAMCDRAMLSGDERGARHPAEDPEFVIMHVDGIEAMGFCSHYKLPHYVTFQSDLENLRASAAKLKAGR
jgi:alpha-D-ribose 1-methylphosphonate 5-triphosphate synthase subunit PhnI